MSGSKGVKFAEEVEVSPDVAGGESGRVSLNDADQNLLRAADGYPEPQQVAADLGNAPDEGDEGAGSGAAPSMMELMYRNREAQGAAGEEAKTGKVESMLSDAATLQEMEVDAAPDPYLYTHGIPEHLSRPSMMTLRHGMNQETYRSVFRQREREAMEEVAKDQEEEIDEEEEARKKAEAVPKKFGVWDGVFARCLVNIFGVIMFLRLGWVIGNAGVLMGTAVMLVSVIITTITTLSLSAIGSNGVVRGGGAYYMISRSLGPEWGGAIGLLFSAANAIAVALYLVGFVETIIEMGGGITGNTENDVRIYGTIAVILLLLLMLGGLSWVVKFQLVLLGALVLAVLSFMFGTFTTSDGGYPDGYSKYTALGDNMFPADESDETFWSVLAVFFPAVTGIMAGANISGELRRPAYDIPVGTLWAIGVSTVVYVVLAWMLAAVADFDLLEDSLVMVKLSLWGPLVLAGIFGATISSAIASFVGAPRVLQAACKDKLFPALEYFAKGEGPGNEPKRGYYLTFVIAECFILIGNLNVIASLITNFFLVSYALINYSCFAVTFARTPGWRPSFRYFNKWVALVGAVCSVVIMFLVDYITSLVTFVVGAAIYRYITHNAPDVNWGSASAAQTYVNALFFQHKLRNVKQHVKTYRPQVLCLSGNPHQRANLVHFVSNGLKKGRGATFYGEVIISETKADGLPRYFAAKSNRYLVTNQLPGFHDVVIAESLRKGAFNLMMNSGLSQMKPNVFLTGYKEYWRSEKERHRASVAHRETARRMIAEGADAEPEKANVSMEDYVGMIGDAFDMRMGVVLARNLSYHDFDSPPSGTIDVYWLVDDGGLTLLLPYLLKKSRYWRESPMRVLVRDLEDELTAEQVQMTRLLGKFRINAEVESFAFPAACDEGDMHDFTRRYEVDVPPALRNKTERYIRLGKAVRSTSARKETALVVIVLPVPMESWPPKLYMAWLETMTHGLNSPVLLVRGNQQSVLTFYS